MALRIAPLVVLLGAALAAPPEAAAQRTERSGAQVVTAQCAKCHQDGKGGAPKIGDREAWSKRLSKGIDHAVHSAISGHGGMPARGDKADLTDSEVRSAILYMFDPKAPPKPTSAK